jgi:translation initiation factor 2 alpha subunit (eIF-2alpha)
LELALRQINEEKKEEKEALDKQISLSNKIIKLICEDRGEDFITFDIS